MRRATVSSADKGSMDIRGEERERLVGWRLRRWQSHIDYDDLRQEARIAAWKATAGPLAGARFTTRVVLATDWAAREFGRSRMCRTGGVTRPGRTPPPEWLPLAAAECLTVPDFAPALLERLALAAAVRGLPDLERKTVRRYYHEGLTLQQIGRLQGVSMQRVAQILTQARARLRAALG
jgi:DNA-directed RNA polymerase specialized sigma24 family protein